MIDTSLSGFVVNVKVLQVVVEINATSAEVSTEKGSVGGENGGNIDVPLSTQRDCETSLPFVEMGNDGLLSLMFREFAEEPGDEVTKDDGFVGFMVVLRGRDTGQVPQVCLPFIQSAKPALQFEIPRTP